MRSSDTGIWMGNMGDVASNRDVDPESMLGLVEMKYSRYVAQGQRGEPYEKREAQESSTLVHDDSKTRRPERRKDRSWRSRTILERSAEH